MALERLRAANADAGFAIACGGGEESEERVLLVQQSLLVCRCLHRRQAPNSAIWRNRVQAIYI